MPPPAIDILLFGALPYVAVVTFLVTSITRYRRAPYTVSSLSSQFLEPRRHFWGSVPFHVGIGVLFLGHLVGFLFPREVLLWNGSSIRLLILEVTGLIAGLLTLAGLIGLMVRRAASPRLRVTTTRSDILVYAVLTFVIVTGVHVAVELRWGSNWYALSVVPYLRSVVRFSPDVTSMATLPVGAKLHVAGAWVLLGVFGASRLMHVLVTPLPYLWRAPQLVIWNRRRRQGGVSS